MADRYLIMTKASAAQISGLASEGHGLDPQPLTDGTYALPLRVLDSDRFAPRHKILRTKHVREVDPNEFVNANLDLESVIEAPKRRRRGS
jgi:hypothetical protein